MEKELASNVWQMSGFIITYTPGMLTLAGDRVSLMTVKGEQFNVSLREIKKVKWPTLQFGYGVHIQVNGTTYKLTFAQPAEHYTIDGGLITDYGRVANGVSALNSLAHLKDYKNEAKLWREVLTVGTEG